MNEDIKKEIGELIDKNDVCLFMKGTPDVPQCGFSLAVSNILKHLGVNFKGVKMLQAKLGSAKPEGEVRLKKK